MASRDAQARHRPYGSRRPRGVTGAATGASAADESAPASIARMRSNFDSFLYEDQAAQEPPGKRRAPSRGVQDTRSSAAADAERANDALQTRCRGLEGDILRLTATVTQKDNELGQLQLLLDREKLARENAAGVSTQNEEQLELQIADLERQKRFLADRTDSTQRELTEVQAELQRTRQTLGDRMRALEAEKQELGARLRELQHAEDHRGRDQGHREQMLQMQLGMRQAELDDTRGELDRVNQQLEARSAELRQQADQGISTSRAAFASQELQRQLADAKEQIKLLQSAQGSGGTATAESERRLRMVERENQYLRETKSNAALIEEKLKDATAQLARAREQASRCAQLEADNQDLRKRQAWAEKFSAVSGDVFSSPDQAARLVAQLQQQLVVAMEDKSRLQSEAASARAEARDTRQRLQQLQGEHESGEAQQKQQEKVLRKLGQRLRFATQERDSIQEVLKAYQAHGKTAKTGPAGDVQQKMQAHADTQATLIQQLQQQVAQLEAKQAEADAAASAASAASAAHASQASAFTDFDPALTRVVHMKDNPLARSLALANDAGSAMETREDAAATESATRELAETRKKLEQAAIKNQRLKEAVNKTIQEFREACYELTGFRVDVMGGMQYHLRSMYAERQEDVLVFQATKSGMQLLETPFSATVAELIEGYLGRFNSIPAFLSAVTLELFSRQTVL